MYSGLVINRVKPPPELIQKLAATLTFINMNQLLVVFYEHFATSRALKNEGPESAMNESY